MSFSLWRMHESVHRNDENQVTVLTALPSIKRAAQKLNVDVYAVDEFAKRVTRSKSNVNRNVFGGLEEEFGVRPVKERRVIKCTAVKGTPSISIVETRVNGAGKDNTPVENADASNDVQTKPRPVWNRQSSAFDKRREPVSDSRLKKVHSSGALRSHEAKPGLKSQQSNVNGLVDKIRQISGSNSHSPARAAQTSMKDTIPNGVPRNGAQGQSKPAVGNDSKASVSAKDITVAESKEVPSSASASRSWAEMLSGQQGRKASPASDQNTTGMASRSTPSVNPAATEIEIDQNAPSLTTEGPNLQPSASIVESIEKATSVPDAASSSIDSDEEIVVFKPKLNRLSAQKNTLKQASRPTTPKSPPKTTPDVEIEPPRFKTQAMTNAPNVNKSTTPKSNARQRATSKHANESSGGRPPAHPPAPVIDPDAFGRDFAVNTHASRSSMRGGRARHSPQASLFDAGINALRPTSSHRPHRKSPSRGSPRMSPAHNTRPVVETINPPSEQKRQETPASSVSQDASSGQRRQLPIGSGRPSVSPALELSSQDAYSTPPRPSLSPPLSIPTLNANAPVFQPGGFSSSLLQTALQPDFSTPKSNPPIQPPIGSGRPSSKTSQLKCAELAEVSPSSQEEPPESTPEVIPAEPLALPAPDFTPPKGPRNSEANFTRRPTFPQQGVAATSASSSRVSSVNHTPPTVNRPNRPSAFRNGDFSRGRGGRSGANVKRPIKPVLFEPDLDSTRAFQPETVESKSSAQADVQYVLKSGTTREEARGRGRLWVG